MCVETAPVGLYLEWSGGLSENSNRLGNMLQLAVVITQWHLGTVKQ